MKLASAQINSQVGQIEENLNEHYRMIKKAIEYQADLIIFPEMSITGYCREEGVDLAFLEMDHRLANLQKLSKEGNIIIIAGAPIKIENELYIGSFIIHPNEVIKVYTKQYLHHGEEQFYSSSFDFNPILELGSDKISFAICADINNEKHPLDANKNKSSIYLPSIFYSENGIVEGYSQLQNYAKAHSLNILMSNYCGELWGMKSGGQSAFWQSNGLLLESLELDETGILIAEKKNDNWVTQRVIL